MRGDDGGVPIGAGQQAQDRPLGAGERIGEELAAFEHARARLRGGVELEGHRRREFAAGAHGQHPPAMDLDEIGFVLVLRHLVLVFGQHEIERLAGARIARRDGDVEADMGERLARRRRLLAAETGERHRLGVARLGHARMEIVHMAVAHQIDAPTAGRSRKCVHGTVR